MAIKYKWLAEKLEEYIYRNMEKGIPKLPTEAQICSRYKVSRQTARHALELLEAKGLISKVQGSGSFFTGLTAQNNRIAVLLQGEQDYTYPRIRQTLEDKIEKAGFSCTFYSAEGSFLKESAILESIAAENYRGVLVQACGGGYPAVNESLYRQIVESGKKLLFLNSPYPTLPKLPSVSYDHSMESRLLLTALSENGKQTIGMFLQVDNTADMTRFQNLVSLIRTSEHSMSEDGLIFYHTSQLQALQKGLPYPECKEKLQKLFDSCSCCICTNDEIAHFISHELKSTRPTMEDFLIAMYEQAFLYEDTYDFPGLIPGDASLEERACENLLDALRGFSPTSEELTVRSSV